ncbi:MAG TPA: hypothetical protein VK327_08530 [Candidatus Paceibacterota bacterium]|nr:hypothetical protein [Candidatus Paceibacterota bacterium]
MRYEESNERRRLSGQLVQRGSRTGFPTTGAVLFGLPFVGIGVGVTLVGMKVIPVNPAGVHAPYWVLSAFGTCFLAAGLMVWGMALRQYKAHRRQLSGSSNSPEARALADYRWDRRGFQPSRWSKVFKTLGGAIGLSVFLSMFNWWAFFSKDGVLMVKIIVGIFDLVLAFAWGYFFLNLSRALIFGESRIEFTRFPYSSSEPILIRWLVANGISNPRQGSFTLRCVEEWWEASGSGDNRSNHLVHEEIWSGTWQLEPSDQLISGKLQELRFEPPVSAPPTNLSAAKPIYWELEVKIELAGPDFVETYLVPVY